MGDLFVYGTLCDDSIVRHLTERKTLHYTNYATLIGYKRLSESVVIPCAKHTVKGMILHDLTPQDIERLDEYEGHPYQWKRQLCPVRIGEENYVEVEAYIPAWLSNGS